VCCLITPKWGPGSPLAFTDTQGAASSLLSRGGRVTPHKASIDTSLAEGVCVRSTFFLLLCGLCGH
jgi:hypothetical protein